jgi:pyrroline-5-carboxylate reductase
MADASDDDVTTLRKHVTSKGGTTETAINCFENANFHQLVKKAMENARNRSVTLADELSKDQS